MCVVNCSFTIAFNDQWNIPSTCNRVKTNVTCAILITMDFTRRQIDILLTGNVQLDVDDNFNSIIIQALQFRFVTQSIQHFVEYLCATGDDCDWLYAKQKVPPLLNIDYSPLYNAIEPLLYESTSSTNVAKCYQNDTLIDCLGGMCSYLPFDISGLPSISRSCSRYNQSELGIIIERRRIDPGPSIHDLDVFGFQCDSVLVSFYNLAHDARYWSIDRERFAPERFLGEDKNPHPYVFIPFGSGHRQCIEQDLVRFELKVIIARMLQQVTFGDGGPKVNSGGHVIGPTITPKYVGVTIEFP
ncbi:unnamed protein product [Rotaria sordida]|uniref:Cytochrome P450 n=1 Tax=Rotaria sordida TaxID=392033 RepID=A0A814H8M8_9BILA|nr:unnamed protein product [Rotaria sordida]CAF1158150.1 unnamed protein product [Rotaria sordida]CAF3604493.1 unnamed protein product [Rotaria sordida]CAF3786602.1 unnamed protein product [Rotaria sordida]